MAGHNKWTQIKHKKETHDQKKAHIFSKLLHNITQAAQAGGGDPRFNASLRAAIEKARAYSVPAKNIEQAIIRTTEKKDSPHPLLLEAYGPGGVAIIITATTDNSNRTISEIKKILHSHGEKLAEPGSVSWAFIFHKDTASWEPRSPHILSPNHEKTLSILLNALRNHPDVANIFHN